MEPTTAATVTTTGIFRILYARCTAALFSSTAIPSPFAIRSSSTFQWLANAIWNAVWRYAGHTSELLYTWSKYVPFGPKHTAIHVAVHTWPKSSSGVAASTPSWPERLGRLESTTMKLNHN
jgi:hypothetical protein